MENSLEMDDSDKAIRMEIKGLMVDPSSSHPVVVLRDEDNEVFLPIWIGVVEANAIAVRIEGIETPRPMTHDLFGAFVTQLGTRIERVTISGLIENTFHAKISLAGNSGIIEIDSRPSDAIAIALRADAPIYVLQSVLDSAQAANLAFDASDEDRLRQWLEDVHPAELGKYKM